MQNFFNKTQIDKIISFAFEAGEIAKKAFLARDFTVEQKIDGSKVSTADIAVSEFLREKLAREFPQIPVICEEGKLRELSGEVFFLIDPIDGTSSFIAGSPEFALNIALIKDKKAVFGLIYAPVFEDGKMIFSNEKNEVVCDNMKKKIILKRRNHGEPKTLRIITSTRSKDVDIENYITQILPHFLQKHKTEKLASAVKFFRILEQDADLYLHFRKSMEWDSAAGQALVELMGGKVKILFSNHAKFEIGEEMIYKKSNFENQPFITFLNQ